MSTLDKIEDILVQRDGVTLAEAQEMVREARDRVQAGDDPEEVLYEEFCLEPDYIFQLLP